MLNRPNITIYDNVFDDRYVRELNEICDNLPNKPGNRANRKTFPYGDVGTHNIMGAMLYKRYSKHVFESTCPLELLKAFQHLADNVIRQNLDLWAIHSNLQSKSMDGTIHADKSPNVMIFTTADWKKSWGGEFQLFDPATPELVETVEYVPGRVVFFDGTIPHRALAPKVPYVYRHSIVYRVNV